MNATIAPITVIIPAAGIGQRMQLDQAKQFIQIEGRSVLAHTVGQFTAWAAEYKHDINIIVVLSADAELPDDVTNVSTCIGGKQRADSVANALNSISVDDQGWIMVHDAARPLVSTRDIEKLYQTLKSDPVGGILACRSTATVKRVQSGQIQSTIPRDEIYLAQTPQMFRFALLQSSLLGNRAQLTDEASGIEALGYTVNVIDGSPQNIKITTIEDLHYAQMILAQKTEAQHD